MSRATDHCSDTDRASRGTVPRRRPYAPPRLDELGRIEPALQSFSPPPPPGGRPPWPPGPP